MSTEPAGPAAPARSGSAELLRWGALLAGVSAVVLLLASLRGPLDDVAFDAMHNEIRYAEPVAYLLRVLAAVSGLNAVVLLLISFRVQR